jgi:hypothetical protein
MPMLILFRIPFPEVAFNDLLRHSTTKRKTRINKGHPCLIPLSDFRNREATLFRRITKQSKLI